ncbi:MAG: PAS domain S-box protein [Methermicoccaceae archaeon]
MEDSAGPKKNRQSINTQEELYQMLVENAIMGAYLLQDSKFVYVNPIFCENLGYTKEKLVGSTFLSFVHYDDREMVADNLRRMIDGETD